MSEKTSLLKEVMKPRMESTYQKEVIYNLETRVFIPKVVTEKL